MAELDEIPLNGYSAVALFAGAGGTCLGFRWAGFRTLWASEFVDRAADTYAANFPGVPVDRRDVRDVQPAEILAATGLAAGQLDVLTGSPPCSPWSSSGLQEEGWGQQRHYSDRVQRVDDLFGEYVRILRGLQPRVFMAENVAGLIRGVSKGHFFTTLRMMEAAGYVVRTAMLDAQWLGVPQVRQRLIFIGVREDLGIVPEHPRPLSYRYTVRDALRPFLEDGVDPDVQPEQWFAIGRPSYLPEWHKTPPGESSRRYFNLKRGALDQPSQTVVAASNSAASASHPLEPRWYSIPELKRITGFPADFRLTGGSRIQAERLGRAVPPPMSEAIALKVKEVLDAAAAR
jgi:DNA (cytosine-5)-methyltransferase 1